MRVRWLFMHYCPPTAQQKVNAIAKGELRSATDGRPHALVGPFNAVIVPQNTIQHLNAAVARSSRRRSKPLCAQIYAGTFFFCYLVAVFVVSRHYFLKAKVVWIREKLQVSK